ncbi:MAG: NAD(P)/FAD-dependent oxidoreductase [Planctomycetes bacterium]|nr:NAD(P)/FAD-dependent oxidoreductase [Planctomycetota bacterium]
MDRTPSSPRILIIGGGFAGAYCVSHLHRKLRPAEADITLVNRSNYFIFFPLLVEAGTGSLEPRHTVVSLRKFLKKTKIRTAEVTGIDLAARRVTAERSDGQPMHFDYDHLVFALGSVTRLPDVPGLREHGFELKSLADAVGLRDRAIELLELADACDDPERRKALLHMVIVGANFSGVELAGEFHVFMRHAARLYPNVSPDECGVTLVEREDRILPALDRSLADYAADHLRGRGVNIRLKQSVTAIGPESATIDNGDTLAAHTVVWTAGIAPNPLIARTGLPTDPRGYIRCERDLRVEGYDHVWAIGDSAVNKDADGHAYPATAQHAVRQGKHLAANLRAVLRGEPTRPCEITNMGSLAALGCRTAVAQVFGFRIAGFPAWFMWRTVYLMKIPGWGRRIRIALDWTINLIFSHEYVQLGLHRARSDDA